MPRPRKPEQSETSLQQDAIAGAKTTKNRTKSLGTLPSTAPATRTGGDGSSAHSFPHAGDGAAVSERSTSRSKSPQSSTQHQQGDDEERIRARAYEYYEERGRQDGSHHEDWLRAEAEVKGKKGQKSA